MNRVLTLTTDCRRLCSAYQQTEPELSAPERPGGYASPRLVNDLSTNTKTRAQVLRAVAEDADLVTGGSNRAFVLMQFFGYLRRNPNDPQDTDYTGYDFWLTKLNHSLDLVFQQPANHSRRVGQVERGKLRYNQTR